MVRTNEEFRREPNTPTSSRKCADHVEKIGESGPVRSRRAITFLSLVSRIGNGSLIAEPGWAETWPIRRGRAEYLETARLGNRSVLLGRPGGMRSTILDDAKEDRENSISF